MLNKIFFTAPEMFTPRIVLEEYIPKDHFLCLVKKHIDFSFVYQEVEHLYSNLGKPSVDPIVLLKMQFLIYLYNVKSERQMVEQAKYNLLYRWFLNYEINDPIPVHSNFCKFRERVGVELYEEFMDRIIIQCRKAGLIGGDTDFIDSTLTKACASKESVRARAKEIFEALDNEEKKGKFKVKILAEANGGEENDSCPEVAYKKPQGEASVSVKGKKSGKKNINKNMASTTDPEAGITSKGGSNLKLAYKDSRLVDGKAGIIICTIATSGAVADEDVIDDLMDKREKILGHKAENMVMDGGYGSGQNVDRVEKRGVNAYTPTRAEKAKNAGNFYTTKSFKYIEEKDIYICPAKKEMKRCGYDKKKKRNRYKCEHCEGCKLKDKCTKGKARHVSRSIYHDTLERTQKRTKSSKGKELMKQRKNICEGSFGDGKENHGHDKTRYRGKHRYQIECYLIATVQNIKKLLKETVKKSKGSVSDTSGKYLKNGQNERKMTPARVQNSSTTENLKHIFTKNREIFC